MKTFFLCLFASSLISGVVCMAAEGSGFEKHIRYLCALIGIAVVISPFLKISLDGEPVMPSYEAVSLPEGKFDPQAIAEENSRQYISSLLEKKFGISCTGVRIDLYSKDDSVTVVGVTVSISGGSAEAVKAYLEEVLGGTVMVEYDIA